MDDPLLKEIKWEEWDDRETAGRVIMASLGIYCYRHIISDTEVRMSVASLGTLLFAAKKMIAAVLISNVHESREQDKRRADAVYA